MEKFGKIVAPTIKELFVDRIVEMILSNQIKVGENLPPERELAEEMGISKTAVHEGIKELARVGLVTVKPQSGVFVADYMVTGSLETFCSVVKFSGNRLPPEMALAIMDLRIAIEGLSMRRFAERHTAEDLADLRRMTQDISDFASRAGAGYDQIAELFFNWHHKLALYSRSAMMPLMFNTMKTVSMDFWKKYLVVNGLGNSIDLLGEFLDLLERRDGAAACALLEEKIMEFCKKSGIV